MTDTFIAVDWGTTNRRAYLVADGVIVAAEVEGPGARQVAPGAYSAEIAGLRQRLGAWPLLCAGMVGSRIGWQELPYVDLPAGIAELAAGTVTAAPDVRIVPGVARRAGRPDVMRGEEVQLLGAALCGKVPPRATLCQPGTHAKWARIEDGKITDFTTAMTGEIYALLRAHSLLAPQLDGAVVPGAAFAEGVARGSAGDLGHELFAVRAAGLLDGLDDADAGALTSGLLIGADVSARLRDTDDATIHVLDDGQLGTLYAEAIRLCGREAALVSSREAFCAGAAAIRAELA
ncbi:2-dehydro-3-deoxygalactonokinase [Sphingosinicella sp. LHD-64]|uniref:2-dehydro-3-deoxygalactonokinase n=1 Tax=Sphingosinicella sp. LHD-64 TaxID=3072139 RepID=UPI00280D2437|nr:2-dehydro-3-deoxygalactonokinase [Sphingosinicella sp. LHD-64]MDQ8757805.1 2-dehydro-3-deoxygalactonokinase [Sphingosinicella sp. LHD-64]